MAIGFIGSFGVFCFVSFNHLSLRSAETVLNFKKAVCLLNTTVSASWHALWAEWGSVLHSKLALTLCSLAGAQK